MAKKQNTGLSVKALRRDAETLLAFNLPKGKTKNLAGFSIEVTPKGQKSYWVKPYYNTADLHCVDRMRFGS